MRVGLVAAVWVSLMLSLWPSQVGASLPTEDMRVGPISTVTVDEGAVATFVDPDTGELIEVVGTLKTVTFANSDAAASTVWGSPVGGVSTMAVCTATSFLGYPSYTQYNQNGTIKAFSYVERSSGCDADWWQVSLMEEVEIPSNPVESQSYTTQPGTRTDSLLQMSCTPVSDWENWRHVESSMEPSQSNVDRWFQCDI